MFLPFFNELSKISDYSKIRFKTQFKVEEAVTEAVRNVAYGKLSENFDGESLVAKRWGYNYSRKCKTLAYLSIAKVLLIILYHTSKVIGEKRTDKHCDFSSGNTKK